MKVAFLLFGLLLSIALADDDCIEEPKIVKYLQGITADKKDTEIVVRGEYIVRRWLYNVQENHLAVEGILEMKWTNTHLAFQDLNPCRENAKLQQGMDNFWKPHVIFLDSETHEEGPSKMMVQSDGNVTLFKKMDQIIPCEIDTTNSPFSNATCTITWKFDNLGEFEKVTYEPPKMFNVLPKKSKKEMELTDITITMPPNNEYSTNYHFALNPKQLLVDYFFPSIAFLIPSWLTLLLGPMAITRCCILMMSLVLQCVHFYANDPPLLGKGGVTAVSVWKTFVYSFIVGIVIELIVITLLASMGRSKSCCFSKRRSAKYEMEPLYEEMNDLRQRKTRKTRNCCRKTALFVDITSFIFSGIVMLAFFYGFYTKRTAMVTLINEFDLESLFIF